MPKGAQMVGWNRGHFYVSGFVKRGDKYAYFATRDVRDSRWHEAILVRTAKNEKDYVGGPNRYASWDKAGTLIGQILS
jgi:hypothetical protein